MALRRILQRFGLLSFYKHRKGEAKGMFEKFKKAMGMMPKEFEIGAPVEGEAVAVSQVSDPTFGEEILGKGIAIIPSVGKVLAPVDGVIDTMFETGHAVSIHSADGTDVLVHVGLDTISLKGKYYTIHKQTGDTIKKGDLLIEFDIEGIKSEGYDVITPVIICNSDEYTFTPHIGAHVKPLDTVITLTPAK